MNKLDFKHLLKRLPIVRQQSQMDCGAACLATICRFDDKRVSLNQIRELTRVGQSGTSMYNLMQAAKSLGYETSSILDIYKNLETSERPPQLLTGAVITGLWFIKQRTNTSQ